VLDIMQLPALTPRQISMLAKHGPNGEYAGALPLLLTLRLEYSTDFLSHLTEAHSGVEAGQKRFVRCLIMSSAPSKVYTVVGGVTTVLDIMQLPALTPRQTSLLAKHGPNGEYAGALLLTPRLESTRAVHWLFESLQLKHSLDLKPRQSALFRAGVLQSRVYVVMRVGARVGGVTTVLDIMQLPALTPRQISLLAKHGPNGENTGALQVLPFR
jgi:hypothetical protein